MVHFSINYLCQKSVFHCRCVVCACSAGAVGSFSNKPLSPKREIKETHKYSAARRFQIQVKKREARLYTHPRDRGCPGSRPTAPPLCSMEPPQNVRRLPVYRSEAGDAADQPADHESRQGSILPGCHRYAANAHKPVSKKACEGVPRSTAWRSCRARGGRGGGVMHDACTAVQHAVRHRLLTTCFHSH